MLKLLNIEKIVIAALLAALAYSAYQLASLDDDLKLANQTIEAKNATIESLSIQSEYLAQRVRLGEEQNIKLQVLGSGGPELTDGRVSSSHLIWVNDQAVMDPHMRESSNATT